VKISKATRSTNRTMGVVFIVLAILVFVWHLGLFWAVHPEMTWQEVLECKQKRVLGGVGLLLWGAVPWLMSIARHCSTRVTYKIRHRGRQIR